VVPKRRVTHEIPTVENVKEVVTSSKKRKPSPTVVETWYRCR